jgi:hypothetical protein
LSTVFGKRLEKGLKRIHIYQYGNCAGCALDQNLNRPTVVAGLSCSKIVFGYRGNDRADRPLLFSRTDSRTYQRTLRFLPT